MQIIVILLLTFKVKKKVNKLNILKVGAATLRFGTGLMLHQTALVEQNQNVAQYLHHKFNQTQIIPYFHCIMLRSSNSFRRQHHTVTQRATRLEDGRRAQLYFCFTMQPPPYRQLANSLCAEVGIQPDSLEEETDC